MMGEEDYKEEPAHREHKVLLVHRVLRDYKEFKETLVHKVCRVCKVLVEHRAYRE